MMMMREYSFGEIWIRIVDARSPGPCCIKGLDESIIRMYSLVPLMHCDMIWPLILIQFTPKECTIKAGLHRQFLSRWSCNFAGVNQVQFSVWFVAAISQRFWTWLKLHSVAMTKITCVNKPPPPPSPPPVPANLPLFAGDSQDFHNIHSSYREDSLRNHLFQQSQTKVVQQTHRRSGGFHFIS